MKNTKGEFLGVDVTLVCMLVIAFLVLGSMFYFIKTGNEQVSNFCIRRGMGRYDRYSHFNDNRPVCINEDYVVKYERVFRTKNKYVVRRRWRIKEDGK